MPIGDGIVELLKDELRLGFASVPMYAYNPALDDPLGLKTFTLKIFVFIKNVDLSFILVCIAVKEALKIFHATSDQKHMSGKSMKGGCGFFIL